MYSRKNHKPNNFTEDECSKASHTIKSVTVSGSEHEIIVFNIAEKQWCLSRDVNTIFFSSASGTCSPLFQKNKRIISYHQLKNIISILGIHVNIPSRGLALVLYPEVKHLEFQRAIQDQTNGKQLYFIYNSSKRNVKIGIANDSIKRLNQIKTQGGFKYELSLIHIETLLPNGVAEKLEKNIHDYFSEFRYVGEWFKLSME